MNYACCKHCGVRLVGIDVEDGLCAGGYDKCWTWVRLQKPETARAVMEHGWRQILPLWEASIDAWLEKGMP